jgi:hypothetical protein
MDDQGTNREGGRGLRYFAAANLWLLVAFYSYTARLKLKISPNSVILPWLLSLAFFAFYLRSSERISLRFGVRSLLIGMAVAAVYFGLLTILLR